VVFKWSTRKLIDILSSVCELMGYCRACRPEQAEKYAGQMIGRKLITKQTGAGGRICNAVSRHEPQSEAYRPVLRKMCTILQIMLAERRNPTHEYYVAILNDRGLGGPALVASRQGGMK